ncbi:MAG: GntR family transcriptional regulator [Mesorhizobium sp.]|uniref:GntR family transcriptional regulator n=1 Tax=Mesorhizobium sp. TaxID=1871066 RepID=UPI000FE4729B|nr:GntR family transcriptional regulator [Mesorhizobium sp.]RWO22456.1 MAG: GntR family transcriptional regulator [Mesorhizobium sp.]
MTIIVRDKVESTYRRLKELVLNYQFRPGEPLSAIAIADRLQVSATPVREALARLFGEDLVELVPNRGFFAKTLNPKMMIDQYEFAFQIIDYAIGRGDNVFVERNSSWLESLNFYIKRGIRENNADAIETNCSFIEELYLRMAELSGNQIVVESIRKFNDQTRFVRLIDLEMESNFHEIAADMSTLVNALARQDVTAAAGNLRHQLDKKLTRMNDIISEGIIRSLRG